MWSVGDSDGILKETSRDYYSIYIAKQKYTKVQDQVIYLNVQKMNTIDDTAIINKIIKQGEINLLYEEHKKLAKDLSTLGSPLSRDAIDIPFIRLTNLKNLITSEKDSKQFITVNNIQLVHRFLQNLQMPKIECLHI